MIVPQWVVLSLSVIGFLGAIVAFMVSLIALDAVDSLVRSGLLTRRIQGAGSEPGPPRVCRVCGCSLRDE